MFRQRIKYLSLGITCFLLGGALLQPAAAHIIASRDAHTLGRKHLSYFAGRTWTKKYFYTKSQANSRYYTKMQADDRYIGNTGDHTMTGTLTANDFTYGSEKTKYLIVPAAAFRPETDLRIFSNGSSIYKHDGGANFVDAPVNLPNGAVIKNLRLYYYDDDGLGAQMYAYLSRVSLTDSTEETIGQVESPVAPEATYGYKSTLADVNFATVNNENYAYYAGVNLGATSSEFLFYHLRIEYTLSVL